jgi:fructan beta-fructosidase
MTIPRELQLLRSKGEIYLAALPVKELQSIEGKTRSITEPDDFTATSKQYKLDLHLDNRQDFFITFANDKDQLVVGYDRSTGRYYIDRSRSGRASFNTEFAQRYFAPATDTTGPLDLTLIMDASSLELFADGGLTNMTTVFFPSSPLTHITIKHELPINRLLYTPLRKIWGAASSETAPRRKKIK